MRTRLLAAVAALSLVASFAAVGSASAATVRHFEGKVVSVDRTAKSFKLRDSQRGTATVFVASSTRFERTSFAALRAGRSVEVTVSRVNGRWQASKVQARAANGGGGGGGGGGADDAPNHG
ncbi:MAG: hypothetical protein QOH72_4938 [Solirubrobacteraceae bacterium]|jgi:cold shock CspA family protein|nr:hypothetical protein [Solirubrobacteraceae bacterium]